MHGTRNRMWGMMMLGLALLLAGGCASTDRYVYDNPATRTATVTLVDALDDEPIWSREVPAEHRLIVRLKRTGEPMAMRVTGQPASSLAWALYESPQTSINDKLWRNHITDGEVELDGRPVRIKVQYHSVAQQRGGPEPENASDDLDQGTEAGEAPAAEDELARRASTLD